MQSEAVIILALSSFPAGSNGRSRLCGGSGVQYGVAGGSLSSREDGLVSGDKPGWLRRGVEGVERRAVDRFAGESGELRDAVCESLVLVRFLLALPGVDPVLEGLSPGARLKSLFPVS